MAVGKASKKLRALIQQRRMAVQYIGGPDTVAKPEDGDELCLALVDTAPVLMWIADLNKERTYVNKVWLEYTGRTMEQETGHGWTEGVHPDDREHCWAIYSTGFEARERVTMEYRLKRADGSYGWVLDTGMPRKTQRGEFLGYVGSCIDITERKKSEAGRAMLEDAIAQTMEGLALMDEGGTFIYVNQAYADMYGFSVSELDGKTWKELYEPDQVELMDTQALAMLKVNEHWCGERVGRRKSGQPFYVEVSLQWLKESPYTDVRIACACRDITKRKWAEAALRASEERYALVLQGSHDGHWDWSVDTNYCYFSPRWKELLGFEDHEIGNHHDSFVSRIHPDDVARVQAAIQAHVMRRMPYDVEVRLRHKSGVYRWFRSRGHAIWNIKGRAHRMAGVLTDRTEQKQAEERFRVVVESAPCGMLMMNGQGVVVLINPQIEALFGYTRDELIGRSVDVLIPDRYRHDDPFQRAACFADPSLRPRATGHEMYGVRKDGTEFPIEIGLNQITTAEGFMVLSSIVDITERQRVHEALRKAHGELESRVDARTAELTVANAALAQEIVERQHAEAELLKSHSLLRSLAAVCPVGIYRADPSGRCLYVNERWSEITGLTLQEAQGDGWTHTLHPDDRDHVFTEWRRSAEGEPPFRAEYRFRRADGTMTWVLGQAVPEFSETGAIIGFVGTITDITSRKRVEMIKTRENGILELIAMGRPLPMILRDLIEALEEQTPGMLGSVLLLDSSGMRLRYAAAPSLPDAYNREMDGLPIGPASGSCGTAAYSRKAVIVDDIERSPLWTSFSHVPLQYGLRACWSRPILSKTGRVLGTVAMYFRVRRVPTDADEELLDVAVQLASIAIERAEAEDTLKRLSETLQERANELMDVNHELEAFSYSVSHDLRTPLRHLEGFADLLRRHAETVLDEKGRQYLMTIVTSAKRMEMLIDDLLAFARIGRTELRTGAVALHGLVQEVLRDLHSDMQGRRIRWQIDELPHVVADASMLRQVFANLIGNALKYTRDRQEARIDIGQGMGSPDEVAVYVRDNGVGFDPQYAHRLFGVFQRLHAAHEFEGNGIGLANVRRIIHRHGGRTWAEGQVGAGATFWFSLPIRRLERS